MKDGEKGKSGLPELKKLLGKYKYVLIVIVAGMVLLTLPKMGEGYPAEASTAREATAEGFDLKALEQSMEDALSQIDGAGDVTVVLTLRGSTRRVLAEDSRSSANEDTTETVVVSKGSSTQDGLLVQEIYPQFRGALVVCSGGGNPSVRLEILASVSALTGLGSDCISICTGH